MIDSVHVVPVCESSVKIRLPAVHIETIDWSTPNQLPSPIDKIAMVAEISVGMRSGSLDARRSYFKMRLKAYLGMKVKPSDNRAIHPMETR